MRYMFKIELVNTPKEIPNKDLFGNAKTRGESLHEALCQAIHEESAEAIQWLRTNVIDIQQVKRSSK